MEENLDLYEIDPDYVMEQDFSEITACLAKLLSSEADGEELRCV